MRNSWKWKLKGITAILCAVIFITLTIIIGVTKEEPIPIDASIRDFFYDIRGEKYGFCYWFFKIFTEFGDMFVIAFITLVFVIYTKCDYRAIIMGLGILSSVMLCIGLKEIFVRERPIEELRWAYEPTASYPSGHSTAAGFMYTYLFYVAYHSKKSNLFKRITYTLCVCLIVIVLISRLVLGVHYFTDVIAGVSVGIMVACFCMKIYKVCDKLDILKEGIFDIVQRGIDE